MRRHKPLGMAEQKSRCSITDVQEVYNRPRDLRPRKFSKETVGRPLPHRHPYPANAQIDLSFIGGARAPLARTDGRLDEAASTRGFFPNSLFATSRRCVYA